MTRPAGAWVREPGARVAGTRDLDRAKVQAPGAVADPAGGVRLFYTAVGPGKPFPDCQGYILSAHSDDGLAFRPDPGIRVAPDPAVVHASLRVLAPTVTRRSDGGWRMYYEARGPAQVPTVICSAVSTDLMNWTSEPGVRLRAVDGVGSPRYIPLPDGGGRLLCCASQFDADGPGLGQRRSQHVLSAVTRDGLHFDLEPGCRLADRTCTQDDLGITAADVLAPPAPGPPWTMLYSAWQDVPPGTVVPRHPSHDAQAVPSGRSADFAAASIASDLAGYRSRIFAATSADGLTWQRTGCIVDGGGPESDGLDAVHAEDMALLHLDDGGCRMYYAACDRRGTWCIASARTAPATPGPATRRPR